MKNLVILVVAAGLLSACSRESGSLEVKPGSSVTLEKKDGVTVAGRLVEVKPELIIVDTPAGRREIARREITNFRADTVATAAAPQAATPPPAADRPLASTAPPASDPAPSATNGDRRAASASPGAATTESEAGRPGVPEYREVTLPTGTVLPVELTTAVGSDSSQVEDAVRGTLRRPVTVDGVQALPAGTTVSGVVTAVERPGRVKGRGLVSFRFSRIDPAGDAERLAMRTESISRMGEATKKADAAKIGGGAAGGAIIGGILGGGDGAAKGAAIGGAAGTGVVLSTRGKDIRLAAGTPVSVKLAAPLTVRVRVE